MIITQIRNTHTIYRLSAADIIDLHQSGVSDKVVQFMINTPSTITPMAQAQSVVVTQAPPPPIQETVVVAPGPGYYWIPGEWTWHGRWVWSRGYWAYPPHGHTMWIGGSWSHGSHGWHHSPGHWR